MKKLIMILVLSMVIGLVFFNLTVSARDIVEFDHANATIWMNPVAWNTLDYNFKIKMIRGFGDTWKTDNRYHFYWTIKEMGSGLNNYWNSKRKITDRFLSV